MLTGTAYSLGELEDLINGIERNGHNIANVEYSVRCVREHLVYDYKIVIR